MVSGTSKQRLGRAGEIHVIPQDDGRDDELASCGTPLPGVLAVVAGPGAEALRAGKLSAEAVDWLKLNFLKTELEFGHGCQRRRENSATGRRKNRPAAGRQAAGRKV